MYPDFKKIKSLTIFFSLLFVCINLNVSYAAGCVYSPTMCTTDLATIETEAPDPRSIVCVLARIVNIFILSAGLVLLYMILLGALKLAMSWGDPKGYLGAQNTFLYAFIGFFVVVGFLVIYSIMASIVGLPSITFTGIVDNMMSGIVNILNAAGVDCIN